MKFKAWILSIVVTVILSVSFQSNSFAEEHSEGATLESYTNLMETVEKQKSDVIVENNDCRIDEFEPNSKTFLADKISLDCYVYGTITDYSYDVDYFELLIPESGKLNITALLGENGEYSRYLSIKLKNSMDQDIAFSSTYHGLTTDGQVMDQYVTPGVYYIEVSQNSSNQNFLIDEMYLFKATLSGAVTTIPVSSVTVNESNLHMNIGESKTLYATVNPSNATEKGVRWTSSNPQVATVDQYGKITALQRGTAIITVQSIDGNKTAIIQVTVSILTIPVQSITVSETQLNLTVGQSRKVYATLSPSNATNKRISWISSDPSIATVDDQGNITAKKQGTTKVTVFSADGRINVVITITIAASNTVPNGNLIPWEPKFDIDVNKVWRVGYNEEIDLSTIIEKNIYVTDRYGNILPMLYIVDRPNFEILISPVKNYMYGEKYTLFIKDIKSKYGRVQNVNVYMEFTIRN